MAFSLVRRHGDDGGGEEKEEGEDKPTFSW